LARRFNVREAFTFEPYTSTELRRILCAKAAKTGVPLPFPVAKAAAEELARESKLRNFGNADAAEALLGRLIAARTERLEREGDEGAGAPITREDLAAVVGTTADPFEGMMPNSSLQAAVSDLQAQVQLCSTLGLPPPPIPHMLFLGPPGTGKTTAARAMAKLLKRAGVLPRDVVVERSAEDLQGKFIGSTTPLVRDMLAQAQGGVLFIDEAHRCERQLTWLVLQMAVGGGVRGPCRDECCRHLGSCGRVGV
jgi:hypothetical protein